MRDFIIVTPRYMHTSNGIKTMHKICHAINTVGGTARLVFIDSNDPHCATVSLRDRSWTNPVWNTPPLVESEKHLIEQSYVVYPEVMVGNPLQAARVIRYFGNREGFCNGKMIGIGANDFLLAHALATRKDAHCILFNSEVNAAFHADGAAPTQQRTLDATYIGKGYLYGEVGALPNSLLIGREWPTPQEQLGILLRNVRCFYTWDSWTSINVEAVLCGAVPYFLRYEPWTEEDIDSTDLGPFYRLDRSKPDFDPVRFSEARLNLRRKIDELVATWDQRVLDFMNKADRHFQERMAGAA